MPARRRVYNKLVRNGIVERLQAKGLRPRFRALAPEEMRLETLRKLIEESKEAYQAHVLADERGPEALLEELADVKLAFDAALKAHGISYARLRLAERQKRARKEVAGFDGCVFLISALDEAQGEA